MKEVFIRIYRAVDWALFAALVPLLGAGLITMNSFVDANAFFERQVVWVVLGFIVFFGASAIDWRFLRRTSVLVILFAVSVFSLLGLFLAGTITQGALSRFDLGAFFVQPSDPAKIVLIALLAKYFSRRHVEIAHYRHILISGLYAFALFLLVFVQPDFGGAIIIFLLWLGMILISGISKKHLLIVFLTGVLIVTGLWFAPVHHLLDTEEPLLQDYQKDRIKTFLNPLADIQGAGYNAYQSTITVGSGQLWGKGVGFGTQSRLQFLPEYETDFIFAAFAEEWGFVGVIILFGLFSFVVWRIVLIALKGASNFETLFGIGVAFLILSHTIIHIGMNLGLLPVTGTVLPFVSYGGSHLMMEFLALGILMGMRGYGRVVPRGRLHEEVPGLR